MSEQINLFNEKETIEFTKTSDPMISAGISGLIKYCDKRIEKKSDIRYEIDGNKLTIESENLNTVLKEMYLEMGEEFYNISNKTSLSNKKSFYYDEAKNKVVQSRYRTYGFSYLLNNSKQRAIGKKVEFEKLSGKAKICINEYLDVNNLKSEKHKVINVNGRNTSVPEYEEMQIADGKQPCSVCGGSFKKTWESKSISPFLKGTSAGVNYVSQMKGAEKVCWKCIYLFLFSILASPQKRNKPDFLDKLFH